MQTAIVTDSTKTLIQNYIPNMSAVAPTKSFTNLYEFVIQVVLSRLMGGLCLLVVAVRGRHRPQRQQKLKNTGITTTSQLVALQLRSDPMDWLQSSAASVPR